MAVGCRWRGHVGGCGGRSTCPRVELAAGQVRVAVAAVGVNFRDVLVALGMYPGGGQLGAEGAGVVVEVGAGVTGVAVGDAVMGLLGVAGSEAVVDERLVVPVPAGLVVGAGRGGAGGVLDGAITGWRIWRGCAPGSRCWCMPPPVGWGWPRCSWPGTGGRRCSSPPAAAKWDTLRAMGFDDDHIGIRGRWSSRRNS